MQQYLPYLIIGVVSGSIYSLAGMGLVLTYKTSGIFNFAQGALSSVAAFVFYVLWVQHKVPLALSLALSIGVLAVLLGLIAEPYALRLSRAPLAIRVAGAVGVLLIIQGIVGILYADSLAYFPTFLPTKTFSIGGVAVGYDQAIVVAISVVMGVALFLFFRFARAGRMMRALVDDPGLMGLSGTNPRFVRRYAWIIGSFFVTLSGLLLSPRLALNSDGLTLLLISAFGAAAVGSFQHIGRTWVGGILIGIIASLTTKWTVTHPSLGGLAASIPFIVLFVALVFSRRRRDQSLESPVQERAGRRMSFRVQATGTAVSLAFFLIVPAFAGVHLSGWTITLTYMILFLSLGLLVRHSGQVSLCHVSFAAIGAVAFSQLCHAGLPWLVALLVSGLIAAPIGAVLAIPAIRSSALYLAIATFGFGLLVQNLFYGQSYMFATNSSARVMPLPVWRALGIGSDVSYYYIVLAVVIVVAILVVLLTRSRMGRLLRALADAPIALAALGTTVSLTRVLIFCLSATIAGIAGALYGVVFSNVTAQSFNPITSLSIVTLIVISVGGAPWYAVLAGIGFGVVPTYLSGNTTFYLQIVFGVSAVIVAAGVAPKPPEWLTRKIEAAKSARLARKALAFLEPRNSASAGPTRIADAELASAVVVERASRPPINHEPLGGLAVEGLGVQFGGLVAVSDLSLRAPTGVITGLIGPNGAGKTTTFNTCSGLIRPTTGRVLLDNRDITGVSVARRARMGLGRTFQRMQLFDSLTVAENVALGKEAGMAGANAFSQFFSGPAERRGIRESAMEAMESCHIDDLAKLEVGSLSTGKRRLVELARCIAGDFRLLLLDEPSSGLDSGETAQFAETLQHIVATRGLGMLLVEHDLELVMNVCQRIYVLDFGTLIFEGAPREVMESEVVRAAYLGDIAVMDA